MNEHPFQTKRWKVCPLAEKESYKSKPKEMTVAGFELQPMLGHSTQGRSVIPWARWRVAVPQVEIFTTRLSGLVVVMLVTVVLVYPHIWCPPRTKKGQGKRKRKVGYAGFKSCWTFHPGQISDTMSQAACHNPTALHPDH